MSTRFARLQEYEAVDTDEDANFTGSTKVHAFTEDDGSADFTETSPIEEVSLTVPNTDDPDLPVWTFRMWFLGLLSCCALSFVNQFFYYRKAPVIIDALAAQIVTLPMGHFMHWALPNWGFNLGGYTFTLNDGPFNIKEHVMITVFANAGAAFGGGSAYGVDIITLMKKFYKVDISFWPATLIVITTQVCGYGWAGLLRRYLVDPSHMWWPSNLVNVSLFRTFHTEDVSPGMSRFRFFAIVASSSFVYYIVPGFLFNTVTALSFVCWIWSSSVTAQQIGSGSNGLGILSLSLDWATITGFNGSPNTTPWFAIVNMFFGFAVVMWVATPLLYWTDAYNAKTFPLVSSSLFCADGSTYDVTQVVNNDGLSLNLTKYEEYGKVHMSTFFALMYGVGFAALSSTVVHVALFHGPEIWSRFRASLSEKPDVHVRLMRRYPALPEWWFLVCLLLSTTVAISVLTIWSDKFQLPWWGLLLATSFSAFMTLPIGVIAATTNKVPGLNIVTEMIWGYLRPGHPIGNILFKIYGYTSMTQALAFLADFKLGLYMKIPPRAMFLVQVIGTTLAALINCTTAFWLLDTVDGICDTNESWSCPSSRVFYDASVIWGLVGPKRFFGSEGIYVEQNWWWLVGALLPVPVFVAHRLFGHKYRWIHLINMPILIGATGNMPPAGAVNFITWFIIAWFFQYYIFHNHKSWWTKYNYVLSAGLDTGIAFMSVLIFFVLTRNNLGIAWWGNNYENCNLASCPTAPNVTALDSVGNYCPANG